MDDQRRYINPKMEEELRQFKEKIIVRLKNGQIPKDFKFPRTTISPPLKDDHINTDSRESLERHLKNRDAQISSEMLMLSSDTP